MYNFEKIIEDKFKNIRIAKFSGLTENTGKISKECKKSEKKPGT
ncbi:MAG: hypothetical protein ACPK85_12885 [Methanosarcina sp.]